MGKIIKKNIDIFASGLGCYCAIAIMILLFYGANFQILNFDSLLAWPITDKIMHPSYYSNGDILVTAGVTGNFLFYRLLAAVTFFESNFAVRDALIYLPIFTTLIVAWYAVFCEISGDRFVSTVAVGILLFANGKLGLNWAGTPLPYLVSYSSVHFLQIIALLMFLKKRKLVALILLGITSYFHPSTSMVYASIFMVIIAYESFKARLYKQLLPITAYVVIMLPNMLMIVSSSQGISGFSEQYFAVYENFAYHAFLEEHFREGYLYTLTLLAAILFVMAKTQLCAHQQRVRLIVSVALVGSALWLINLYFFKNLQVLQTYYVTRSFYWLKPLAIILFMCIVRRLSDRTLHVYAALPVIVTLMVFPPFFSLIVLLSWLACHVRPILAPAVFFVSIIAAMLLHYGFDLHALRYLLVKVPRNNASVWYETAYFIVLLPVILVGVKKLAAKLDGSTFASDVNLPQKFKILVCAAIVSVAFYAVYKHYNSKDFFNVAQINEKTNFGLALKYPDYSSLLDWVKKSDGKLFVVPPNDFTFMSFRFITKKGVFIHLTDINQLSYSPLYYLEGVERLKALGLHIWQRHEYAWTGYANVPADYLKSKGVDYVVYNKQENNVIKQNSLPDYENNTFAVYSVTR